MRLYVDKERNRVVVGEASADFVDILFSFLTLPLGTIIRLFSNQLHIGCINNLYRSLQELDTQVFWNELCHQMLLHPRNPCESLCEKLRFNVDDTEPTKYFMCESCGGGGRDLLLSTFAGLKCSCGKLMNKEMKLQEGDDPKEDKTRNGVFVEASTTYLIFDDLKVLQNSATNCAHQLVQLGYTSFDKLTLISPTLGFNQILELLKRALISKSALTDVFLGVEDEGRSKPTCSFTPNQKANTSSSFGQFYPLRITLSKSKNKILFAEAEADYFDFLFSFLTTPLGSILNLLDGKISLGSTQNLYESVKTLSSSSLGTPILLDLQVAPQYGCTKQPLKLREGETCTYWYGTHVIRGNKCYENKNGKIFDPRSGDGRRENAVGFVRRPSVFVVTDDLHVTPFTSASSISFLEKLNVPLDDLEEHVVKIEYSEALNLLGASLTSKAALTNGLLHLLKKPKGKATS
ncbi:uncharacterized protein G2W53_002323 [Senna tora]|uniref:DUF674 family protein n=1 Tax=Senna tora TaxID=362788 RepID=A0A834XJ23_9FABA|nr:uncharacterized protein G2W53_002323 [Senna tora]